MYWDAPVEKARYYKITKPDKKDIFKNKDMITWGSYCGFKLTLLQLKNNLEFNNGKHFPLMIFNRFMTEKYETAYQLAMALFQMDMN